MNHLRDLYQQVIVEHGRKPRNFYVQPHATHQAEGYNPLCGDTMTLYLTLEKDVIQQASFQGSGCAISMASASLMSETLKGKTVQEAQVLFGQFHHLVTQDKKSTTDQLGKLTVLAGVKEFPARVKCATLAWHTMDAALAEHPKHATPVVTTE